MRERVWEAPHVELAAVTLDTDTTVHTLFGHQMGGRKSCNPKNKGKNSYQPILTFLAETREYISGELRKGIESGAAHSAMMLLCTTAKTRLPDCRNCAKATLDEPAFTTAPRRELKKAAPTDRVTERCPLPPNSSRIAPTTGQMDLPRINNLAIFPLRDQPFRYLDTVEVCSSSLHRPTIFSIT